MNPAVMLFFFILGCVVSAPAWMAYALSEDRKRREWAARRREREGRRGV